MQQLYLTRRNLLSLLSKLDRKKAGESTACTLIKQDILHPKYPCSDVVFVTALEDAEYYVDREPGDVHPKDDPKFDEPKRLPGQPKSGPPADIAGIDE